MWEQGLNFKVGVKNSAFENYFPPVCKNEVHNMKDNLSHAHMETSKMAEHLKSAQEKISSKDNELKKLSAVVEELKRDVNKKTYEADTKDGECQLKHFT